MSKSDLQQLNSQGEAEQAVETVTEPSPQRKKLNKFVDILLWVVIALLAVSLLVRIFFVTQITVKGESMMETLYDGQVVTVSKVKSPNRGDVVVFYDKDGTSKFLDIFNSDKHDKLIKRVIALAGDKLWVEEVAEASSPLYKVLVESADGKDTYQDEFYVNDSADSGLGILDNHVGKDNALVIDDDCFFAMGDNRDKSLDSRSFRAVPMSRLYGVVINI